MYAVRRYIARAALGLIALGFTSICLPDTFAQDELPDLVRRIKPAAVAIETFDARGEKLSRGSPVVNMHGQVIGVATLQITGGQSVNFAFPSERIAQLDRTAQTENSQLSLGELVVATGRNKRAKAVEYFRDGLTFLSKDDC